MHSTLRGGGWTCTLVFVACLAFACGDDDGGQPRDAGDEDSGEAGSGATSGSGGVGATSGSGGVGATSGTGGAADEGDEFLRQYAAAVCAMYESCCDDESLPYDAEGCTDWFASVTAAYFYEVFQPEAGMRCLQELATANAADPDRCRNVRDFDLATLRGLCAQAFKPEPRDGAALGGDCLLASDCATPPVDDPGYVICYGGFCLSERRGVEGEGPCFFGAGDGIEGRPTHASRCRAEDGLYCDRMLNQCAPHVAIGERCPRADACSPDAMCVGGICTALPAIGEMCLNAIQGAGGYCAFGNACDVSTLECGPGLAEGEACREDRQCVDLSCEGTCRAPQFTRSLNCSGDNDQ